MSSFSTNPLPSSFSVPNTTATETDFLATLQAASEKNLPPLIREVAIAGEAGITALMTWLRDRSAQPSTDTTPDLAAGAAYQALFAANTPATITYLQHQFPTGIVPLRSQANVIYHDLQLLLAQQEFEAADRLTLAKLCELAGETAVQRKWIYFTEVDQFPVEDLQTIDALWQVHSEGRFGFSVQRRLWLSVGKNWDKLWPKIGWKDGINWTRYPQGFTWDLSAPQGHLPLSNQLRGVRMMAALMEHPAWN